MVKLTKFTISPSGQLVYRSTGKLAPSTYTFRKNTVYGPDGRRIGSLSRKITRKEAQRIAKAESNRLKRTKAAGRPSKAKPRKPKAPMPTDQAQQYGKDWDQFDTSEFPEAEQAVKEEFAQRVREAALSVAPPWLQKRIQAFTTAALWKAYEEDAYIFELFFKYHQAYDAPHKSDVSMWLYQFVTRIEQYMGVKL